MDPSSNQNIGSAKIDDTIATDLVKIKLDSQEAINLHKLKLTSAIPNKLVKEQYDFINLVAKSKFTSQQKLWNEQFQRSTTDVIKYYAKNISYLVKANKDLKEIFDNLNLDLEKLKTPRKSFVKKLTLALLENKVNFSDSLKDNLQSLSVVGNKIISSSNSYVDNIKKERSYCLGKNIKSSKSRA